MTTALHAFCGAAGWAALCYMLHALHHNRDDRALRWLCVAFGFSAISFTLLIPAVWVGVDSLLGIPNIAALIAMSCVTILVFGQQIALQHWRHPPAVAHRKARNRIIVCGLALAGMTVLFFRLSPSVQRPMDFSVYYGHNPYYFAYLLLYTSLYTSSQVIIAQTAWKCAKETENLCLRRGLDFVAMGAWITLGYSAIRVGNLFGPLVGFDFSRRDEIALLSGNIGSFLIILGFTFPGWGARLQLAGRWRMHLLNYHRLYPLWEAMHRDLPEIALFPPGSRICDILKISGVEYRLYRRVIEIRDAQLALLPYAERAAVDSANESARRAGLSEEEVRAITAATAIRTALERRSVGRPSPEELVLPHPAGGTASDLDSEVTELLRIAQALSRPRIVTTVDADEKKEDFARGV